MAPAGAALLAWAVHFLIWSRDVMLPQQAARLAHATAVGRVESRAGLESLRDAAAHLQFAARAWYAAAGAPALATPAVQAAQTVRAQGSAGPEGSGAVPTP